MIIDRRSPPIRYHQYMALKKRLNKKDFTPLQLTYLSYRSGYKGETSLDYYLKLLNHEDLVIIHDIRLPIMNDFFQIDTLVLGRSFFLIIEAKNYSGTVRVSPKSQQLVRTYEEKDFAFHDPLEQARSASRKLRRWFIDNGFQNISNLPHYEQVVFTNENTPYYIDTDIAAVADKYCRPTVLFEKIEKLQNYNTDKQIPFTEINAVAKALINAHQPWFPDYEKLDYFVDNLRRGVSCKTCVEKNMTYISHKKKWVCPKCKFVLKDGYLEVLYHYALLINEDISNKDFQEFLNIPSRTIAYKWLKSLNLPTSGSNSRRKYSLKGFLTGEKTIDF